MVRGYVVGGCVMIAWLTVLGLVGCGGGGSVGLSSGGDSTPDTGADSGDSGGGPLDGLARDELATAYFDVDTSSGEVAVQPAGATAESRALFTGGAIEFHSSRVLDQAGGTGVRVLEVSMTNRWGRPIGQNPDGTVTGLRVLFDRFTKGPSSGLAAASTVSTIGVLAEANLTGIAAAGDGSVYVADSTTGRILRLQHGTFEVVAGGAGGSVDGGGTAAGFAGPRGLAIDPTDGALIVAESGGNRVRRIAADGRVTTIAGGGVLDGSGSTTWLATPTAVAVDASGTIYVADYAHNRIVRLARTGSNPALSSHWTFSVLAQNVSWPWGLDIAPDGVLYVSSQAQQAVFRVTPAGLASRIAGDGTGSSVDGPGNTARFNYPAGVTCANGMVFVSEDGGHRVRRLRLSSGAATDAANWRVETVAGNGPGNADGSGLVARFNRPFMIDAAPGGTLYVADYENHAVRRVSVAGGTFSEGDGLTYNDEPVRLSNPTGYVPGPNNTALPFIDYQWYDLATPSRSVLANGETSPAQEWWFVIPLEVRSFSFRVTVYAPTGGLVPVETSNNTAGPGSGSVNTVVRTIAGSTGDVQGYIDGPAPNARFSNPFVTPDRFGNVFIADYNNNAVRRLSNTGRVVTIAGGSAGSDDGTGQVAKFSNPARLAVNEDATVIYVPEMGNHTIRRMVLTPGTDPEVASNWSVATIAGVANAAGYNDATGAAARFTQPRGVALVSPSELYVVEYGGNRVRRLRLTGGDAQMAANWQVTTVAGNGSLGYADGSKTAARFNHPTSICADAAGALYISDSDNRRVRKVLPDGTVTTLAGFSTGGCIDGSGVNARFESLLDITVDAAGYLYVADFGNNRIRRVSPTGVVSTVAGTGKTGWSDGTAYVAGLFHPSSVAVDAAGDLYVADGSGGTRIRKIERIVGGR